MININIDNAHTLASQRPFFAKRSKLWEGTAFFSVIVIIALNAYLAFRTIDDLSARHRSITNIGNTIVVLKDLDYAVLAAESGQRGYLLTGKEIYLAPYYEALEVLDKKIIAVTMIHAERPEQAARIKSLVDTIQSKLGEMRRTVELHRQNKEKKALSVVNADTGRRLSLQITELVASLEAQEFALQSRLYTEFAGAERDARLLFSVFFIICISLLVGAFIIQRKRLASEYAHQKELEQRAEALEDVVAQRTQELQVYSDELSRSNRELEDFAFVASHDLQEPLRKVRAFSSRIKKLYEEKLDEKGVDYLSRMDKAAERMSALIQDLLAFSRIKTRGKEFVEVELDDVVASVLEDLELAIEESTATIVTSPLPKVEADVSQMNQLFLNLLSNAIKFRRPNLVPKVDISYQKIIKEEGGVELEYHQIRIKDNGIGFDQEYHDKIFLPFQRLHAREEYEGTGIGLAVCRRIVERHGGVLEANSRPSEGAEFVITLPLVVIDLSQL